MIELVKGPTLHNFNPVLESSPSFRVAYCPSGELLPVWRVFSSESINYPAPTQARNRFVISAVLGKSEDNLR